MREVTEGFSSTGEVHFCVEAILACQLHFVSYATPLILKVSKAFTHCGGGILQNLSIFEPAVRVFIQLGSHHTEVLEHKIASTVTRITC